jgi:hypothetical protein
MVGNPNLLSVFIFLKFVQKKLSVGDARRRNIKIKRKLKIKPLLPGHSEDKNRDSGELRKYSMKSYDFCPLAARERFWFVSRSRDNLKTDWIETRSNKKAISFSLLEADSNPKWSHLFIIIDSQNRTPTKAPSDS